MLIRFTRDLRDHTPEFRELAAFDSTLSDFACPSRWPISAAEPYKGEFVSGNYFTMFWYPRFRRSTPCATG